MLSLNRVAELSSNAFFSHVRKFFFKTVVIRIAAEKHGTSCEFVPQCLPYSYELMFFLFNSIEIFRCS